MDRDIRNICLSAVAAVLVILAYGVSTSPRLFWEDSFDYAQLARNLAEGRGFSSWKANVALLENYPLEGQPSLVRAPLVPLMTAALFRVFGICDSAVMAQSLLFFVLLAPLTYLLARKILGPGESLAAVLVLTVNRLALHYSFAGAAEMPFAFFLSMSVLLLLSQAPLCAGMAAGFAYLSRYDMVFFLPFLAVFLVQGTPHPGRVLRRFVLAFAVTALPWWVRNSLVTGNPFFSFHNMVFAMYSDTYPSYTLYGTWIQGSPSRFLLSYLASHPLEFAVKMLRGLRSLSVHLPDAVEPPILALTLAGFVLSAKGLQRSLGGLFLTLALAYFVVITAINAYWSDGQRYFIAFLPILSVYSVLGWKRLTLGRRARAWALALGGWLLVLGLRPAFPRIPLTDPVTLSEVEAMTGKASVITAPYPSQISWSAHRRTLALPSDFATLRRLELAGLAPDFIFLNGSLFLEEDDEDPRMGPLWADFKGAFLRGGGLPGYHLAGRLTGGLVFARGA